MMPIIVLTAVVGFLAGPVAHHVAVQAGADRPWAWSAAACRRCGEPHARLVGPCPNCGLGANRVWLSAVVLGAVAGAFAWRFDGQFAVVAYLWFAFLTVVLFITDIDHKRIPNRVTYPGTPIAALLLTAAAALDGTFSAVPRALAGSLVYAGFFLAVYLVARGGFGFGDVKLALLLGLFLAYVGWDRLLVSGFLTAAVGGAMAVVALVAGGAGAKTEIPYGPAMIIGAWATIIGGDRLADLFV